MTRRSGAAALAGLTVCTLVVLAPAAGADTVPPRTKAQIEHDELAGGQPTHPTKAQVEANERAELTGGQHRATGTGQSSTRPASGGTAGSDDATAAQLALAAALGAIATGGAVLVSRRIGQHRHAVAQ